LLGKDAIPTEKAEIAAGWRRPMQKPGRGARAYLAIVLFEAIEAPC